MPLDIISILNIMIALSVIFLSYVSCKLHEEEKAHLC